MATICNMWGQVASHTKCSTGQYWDIQRNTNKDFFVDNDAIIKFLTFIAVLQLNKRISVFYEIYSEVFKS